MSTFLRKNGKVLVSVFIVILFCVVAYIGILKSLRIETIEVHSDKVSIAIDRNTFPDNLFFFPSESVRAEILSKYITLSDVKFEKKYPHTLIIVPVLRTPVSTLITDTQMLLLDEQAIVLGYNDHNLPLTAIRTKKYGFRIGSKIRDKNIALASKLIVLLGPVWPIKEITDSGEAYITLVIDRSKILVGQNSNPETVRSTLQTLFEGFRIKGRLPTVVDLRFDKPVIRF